jgi:hypothetical protein
MNQSPENPRAVIGDNVAVDHGAQVAAALARDYAATSQAITAALDKARTLPAKVESEEDALWTGGVIKEMRDLDKRVEALREAEKAPHLQAGSAVDAFFFALREKLARRQKNARPGALDVLQGRVDEFIERRRIEEESRRRREADEAARIAREAQEKADREARAAEEAQRVAARARNPERIEEKKAGAQEAQAVAGASQAEAALATERAQDAHIATLAKPADMVRTRGEGVLLTSAREPFAIVVDRALLDKAALWPFFTDAEIEKAFRGWARSTNHAKPMAGAEVGHKAKGVTR